MSNSNRDFNATAAYNTLEEYAYRTKFEDMLIYVNGDLENLSVVQNFFLKVIFRWRYTIGKIAMSKAYYPDELVDLLDYMDKSLCPANGDFYNAHKDSFYYVIEAASSMAVSIQPDGLKITKEMVLKDLNIYDVEILTEGNIPLTIDSSTLTLIEKVYLLFDEDVGNLLPYIEDIDESIRALARWRLERGE